MEIIKLDIHLTNCKMCNKKISIETCFALPIYEDKVDYNSNVSFPVCDDCFNLYEKKMKEYYKLYRDAIYETPFGYQPTCSWKGTNFQKLERKIIEINKLLKGEK